MSSASENYLIISIIILLFPCLLLYEICSHIWYVGMLEYILHETWFFSFLVQVWLLSLWPTLWEMLHIHTTKSVSELEGLEETNQANQASTCFRVLRRNVSKGKDSYSLQEERGAASSPISVLNVKSKGVSGMQSKGVVAVGVHIPELAFN